MIKIDTIDEVIWDRLPVFKIIKYTFEHKAFKPFAQVRLCYQPDRGLLIRMWAFEVDPLCKVILNHDVNIFNDSVLSVVLGNKYNQYVIITFNKRGCYFIKYYNDRDIAVKEKLEINCFEGEDLQGIYWGGDLLISDLFLRKYLNFRVNSEDKLYVNFIKSCYDKNYYHCGGFVDIKKDWIINLEEAIIN